MWEYWLLNPSYSDFEYVLEKNDRLNNATQEYEAATIVQSTFVNEGYGELYLYIYPQFNRSADLLTYLPLQPLHLNLVMSGFDRAERKGNQTTPDGWLRTHKVPSPVSCVSALLARSSPPRLIVALLTTFLIFLFYFCTLPLHFLARRTSCYLPSLPDEQLNRSTNHNALNIYRLAIAYPLLHNTLRHSLVSYPVIGPSYQCFSLACKPVYCYWMNDQHLWFVLLIINSLRMRFGLSLLMVCIFQTQ